MKQWLQDIFYCEFSLETDNEVLVRILMYNVFLLVFLITAISFAIFHAARGAYFMAFILLAGCALLIGVREYIRITKDHQRGFKVAAVFTLPVFLINFITGGIQNCGPLWHYCYPMVALLLVGPRWGSLASIALIGVSMLLLVAPFNLLMLTSYTPEFLLRFFISYMIVYFLAFTYELQKRRARTRLKILSGLLPICASCKKIRDDKGYWNQIEAYIAEHSKAEFSHSICPECSQKLYPEYDFKAQSAPPPPAA